MTSKNSFLQISKWNFRKRLPYMILCFIGCFFFMPVYTFMNCMISLQNIRDSLERVDTTVLEQDLVWIRQNNVPVATFGDGIHFLLIVVMAIVFSITAFSWINSVKKVDFYKALPVKEKTRFVYIHINSVLMFIICYGVNLILNNLSVAYWGLYSIEYLQASLISFVYNIIAFLAVYFLVCIAQQLTGTSVLAVLGALFLIGVEPLLMVLRELFKTEFYKTYFYYDRNSEILSIKNGLITPVGAYIRGYKGISEAHNNFMEMANYKNLLLPMLCLLVQAIVFAVVTYLLYKKRASYAGNNNIAFSFAKPIVKVVVMIAAALTLELMFYDLSGYSLTAGVFGLVSGIILMQIIMQFVMEGDFKQITKGIPSMLIGLVITVALSVYFPLTAKNFDSYLPNQEELASVAIVRNGEYIKEIYNDDYEMESSRNYLLEQMEMNEPQVMTALLNTMKECMDYNQYTSENVQNYSQVENVQVRYTLKNGKKVYRSYLLDLEKVRGLYDVYYDSESYKQTANSLTNDIYSLEMNKAHNRVMNIEYESYMNDGISQIWTQESECEELYQALKQDVYERTIDIENTEIPIGRIRLKSRLHNLYSAYYITYAQCDLPVYKTDKHLLALFAEKGIANTEMVKESILSIDVCCDINGLKQTSESGQNINYAVEDVATEILSAENTFDPKIQIYNGDKYFEQVIDNSIGYDAMGLKLDGERMVEEYYYGTIHFENGSVCDCKFKKGTIPEPVKSLLINQ